MKKARLVYKMSIRKMLVYITSAVAAFSLCACSREAGQPQSESPAVVVSEPMTQEAATKAQEEADKLQEAAPGTQETEPGSPEAVTVEPEATVEDSGKAESEDTGTALLLTLVPKMNRGTVPLFHLPSI